MSFQWTIIATFLYAEIGMVILFLLPLVSPIRSQKLFKSRVLQSVEKQANFYFNMFIVILVLFFVDAIREVKRFAGEVDGLKHDGHSHFEADLQIHMKLFRAQRNFYISGFALFLWLVIRRLVTLISAQAVLLAENSAVLKQAQSATDTANELLKEKDKRVATEGEAADNLGNIAKEEYEKEIAQLKDRLKSSTDELNHAKLDVDSMRKQAESVNKEYDRLLKDYADLQTKLEHAEGTTHDKKGD